jgi:hypothetical protein
MEKINLFLEKHGTKLILTFIILTWLKTCSIDSEVTTLKKEARIEKIVIDSLPSATDIKIEGLNVEKRMIQATDRKMLDVQRQTQIEKEIKDLEGIK